MPRMRGALPSPRHRLASAVPHKIVGATPTEFIWPTGQVSMWGNDIYGDCVTAEEAFKNACDSPAVFIPDDVVLAWATAGGFLDGANLTDVMDAMQNVPGAQGGFIPGDGNQYDDGPPNSVDWTNAAILNNAIVQGPVKIGVAADQLETAVGTSDPPPDGWLASGFTPDPNEDHCVSLFGFGSITWLLGRLSGTVPDGVDGSLPGLALFTWKSRGVIDWPSLQAICGEAWLRTPNTIINQTGGT